MKHVMSCIGLLPIVSLTLYYAIKSKLTNIDIEMLYVKLNLINVKVP